MRVNSGSQHSDLIVCTTLKTSPSTVGISKQDQLTFLQTTEAPQHREPTGQLV